MGVGSLAPPALKNIGSGETLIQNFCAMEFKHYITHLIDVSNGLSSVLPMDLYIWRYVPVLTPLLNKGFVCH